MSSADPHLYFGAWLRIVVTWSLAERDSSFWFIFLFASKHQRGSGWFGFRRSREDLEWLVNVLRARSFWAGFHVEICGRLLWQDAPAWNGEGMSILSMSFSCFSRKTRLRSASFLPERHIAQGRPAARKTAKGSALLKKPYPLQVHVWSRCYEFHHRIMMLESVGDVQIGFETYLKHLYIFQSRMVINCRWWHPRLWRWKKPRRVWSKCELLQLSSLSD